MPMVNLFFWSYHSPMFRVADLTGKLGLTRIDPKYYYLNIFF